MLWSVRISFITHGQVRLHDFHCHSALRPLAFRDAGAVVLAFAVDDWHSFAELPTWRAELLYYVPHVPFLLCACKIDTRQAHAANTFTLDANPDTAFHVMAGDERETDSLAALSLAYPVSADQVMTESFLGSEHQGYFMAQFLEAKGYFECTTAKDYPALNSKDTSSSSNAIPRENKEHVRDGTVEQLLNKAIAMGLAQFEIALEAAKL